MDVDKFQEVGDRVLRLVVAVIAYESASKIAAVLDRIPDDVLGVRPTVLVADDHSSDGTYAAALDWADRHPDADITVVRWPSNLGYGGNQVACYRWAAEHGADAAVLVHGDGQYPPEQAAEMFRPIVDGNADAVFGSRMLLRGGARAGGMPLRRYLGNKTLTSTLNVLAGADLSEWFSGFRAFRIVALSGVGFESLSAGFDIDTEVTFRLLEAGYRVEEISIPTLYKGDVSRVPLMRTGLRSLRQGLGSRRRRARNR